MTTTNQRAVELAPCPFCGSAFVSCCEVVGSAYQVLCEDCVGGGPPESTAPEAIAAWNRRAPGWRPISEAPRDGTAVLLFGGGGCYGWTPPENMKNFPASISYWDAGKSAWVEATGEQYERHDQPTHFMPLPPPPGEAE